MEWCAHGGERNTTSHLDITSDESAMKSPGNQHTHTSAHSTASCVVLCCGFVPQWNWTLAATPYREALCWAIWSRCWSRSTATTLWHPNANCTVFPVTDRNSSVRMISGAAVRSSDEAAVGRMNGSVTTSPAERIEHHVIWLAHCCDVRCHLLWCH